MRGGWRTPDGRPPLGGRPAKGGEKIAVRLSASASAALARLREKRGLSTTQAVEFALLEVANRDDG